MKQNTATIARFLMVLFIGRFLSFNFSTFTFYFSQHPVYAKTKKAKMPLVAGFIEKNHDALVADLVIGNYKFTLVTREELTAIRIEEEPA